MTTLQVRTDEKKKKKAQHILKRLGLDLSAAVNVYLDQIIIRKGIPFQILTENGMTPEREMEILKASDEAKKGINVTKPMSPKEAIDYLKKLR